MRNWSRADLGAVPGDDEIMSLARAFLAAGTRQVIVTLWPVWDRTTRSLMLDLYTGLQQGLAPAEALCAAQLRLRATHGHPYYWAPFLTVGG